MTLTPGIIFYFFTVIIQFRLLTPAILITMQVHFDTQFMKGLYFIKDVENTTIIDRKGNIKRDYVQVFSHLSTTNQDR
jgi:hypothetical protein